MKKILFIVPEFPSVSETFIVNQITSLMDLGYDVSIYSLGKPEKIILHEKILNYNLQDRVIYPNYVSFLKRLKLFLKSLFTQYAKVSCRSIHPLKYGKKAFRLTNFLRAQAFFNKDFNFDIVHIHFGQCLETYEFLKDIGLLTPKKVFLTFHGYDLDPKEEIFNRERYKRLYDNAIHVTINTPYLEGILKKTLPGYYNYSILPVGLDTHYFEPIDDRGNVKDSLNIAFCGRFIKLKGVHRLADIISRTLEIFHNKKLVFHIIGDGDAILKEDFLTNTEYFRQEGVVRYYGALSQEDIIAILQEVDVFMLPGIVDNQRAETQGLVIQEAQSLGIPVVVTNAGGMRYGLEAGKTGLVVDYQSDEEFSNAVVRLLANDELRITMGQAARDFVVKNYDSKILANRLIEIYNKD